MSNQTAKGSFKAARLLPPLLLAAAFILLSLSTASLQSLPRRLGTTLGGSLQKAFASAGSAVNGAFSWWNRLKDLESQNRELTHALEKHSNLERAYADLRAENDRLREQMGYARSEDVTLIAAKIIAKDPANLSTGFTIDQGSSDGIRKNMPVVAFQNGIEGIVGKVVQVGATSAIVVPLYDSRLFVAARLARTRYEGLVSGQGQMTSPLMLKYVSKRAAIELQFGDMVVSSGLDSIYPPDISIGRVREIRQPDYQSSADILLDPALDMGILEYVFALDIQVRQ